MVKRTTLVFGTKGSVDQASAVVAGALSIVLRRRESLYRGGDYWVRRATSDPMSVRVQANRAMEDDLAEDVDLPTLIYVEGTTDPEAIMAAIGEHVTLIRRTEETRPPSIDLA